MSFLIRQATNRDTESIAAIVKATYDSYGWTWEPEGYCADLYDVEEHYWKAGHGFWVAESIMDSKLIGTVGLMLFSPIPFHEENTVLHEDRVRVTASDCSLERLYVHPESQGAGAGTALLDHAIAVALSHGKKRMEIWSDKKLEAAHRLYRKFGAVDAGERICHDPDQSPEWGLMLSLRGEVAID